MRTKNQETIRDMIHWMKEEGLIASEEQNPNYRAKPLSDADKVEAYRKFQEEGSETYQKIENTVVGAYQKIEDSVVGTYKNIEGQFVGHFLTRKGETTDEALERLKKEQNR